MESSTTGNFHDYKPKESSFRQHGVGAEGGGRESDQCELTIENARLEEIELSEYFKATFGVPEVGMKIQVRSTLEGGRISVETQTENKSVGFLPTKFNYVLGCMRAGKSYRGTVIASGAMPIPRVVVQLFPS